MIHTSLHDEIIMTRIPLQRYIKKKELKFLRTGGHVTGGSVVMATGVVTWTHVYCGHADPSAVWMYMVRRPSPHSTGGHMVVVTIGMHSY